MGTISRELSLLKMITLKVEGIFSKIISKIQYSSMFKVTEQQKQTHDTMNTFRFFYTNKILRFNT